MNWIDPNKMDVPLADRLPKNKQRVLIAHNYQKNKVITATYYQKEYDGTTDRVFVADDGGCYRLIDGERTHGVTLWMETPKLPEL